VSEKVPWPKLSQPVFWLVIAEIKWFRGQIFVTTLKSSSRFRKFCIVLKPLKLCNRSLHHDIVMQVAYGGLLLLKLLIGW